MIKHSLLEEAVEDTLVSMLEDEIRLPPKVDVYYSEAEWEVVEKFHRFRVTKDNKRGLAKDRWPFIRLHILGIDVNLMPEPKFTETIH